MKALLIAYAVFLLGIVIFGGAGLYHIGKYSFPGDKSKLGGAIYVVLVAAIIIGSVIFIISTDWSAAA